VVALPPQRGDVVWISLDPTIGHEQQGRRPAVVISRERQNRVTGLALLCPVTNSPKGYPFEVRLPGGLSVTGAVLCDHVKSLDWRGRNAEFITALPEDVTAIILATVRRLLD
jgi:mRNA interferase MazF